jgi:RNA binding exosome subunit
MSLHGGTWRVHASAVDDLELINNAISWLAGNNAEISVEHEKSSLGAPMAIIVAKMNKKSAMDSLERFENEQLRGLLENELELKIDEEKILHVRASLEDLVRGMAIFESRSSRPVVKGRFKLEVYPTQDPSSIAAGLLNELMSRQ